MAGRTHVIFNGSKWAGQEPDSVEVLLELLGKEPLNPAFEHYGDFAGKAEGEAFVEAYGEGTHFHGNFLNVSHAFGIVTSDPEVEAKLFAAIKANKERADYVSARLPALANCACPRCWPDKNVPHPERARRQAEATAAFRGPVYSRLGTPRRP